MITTDLQSDFLPPNVFLIVGYGVTGKAVATFLEKRGCSYWIADDNAEIVSPGKYFLGKIRSINSELQNESGALVKITFAKAIVSPGFPPTHPVIKWLNENQIPQIGELEVASLFLKGKLIGVTGTNGKSTTVKLIQALLIDSAQSSFLGGNIGTPLIAAVDEPPKDYYVIEESSYQLEQNRTMHHSIAVCMNVTDDHFDRYADITEYAKAKENILKNITSSDAFVFNADDQHCLKMSWNTPAINYPFSLVNHFDCGGFVKGHDMVISLNGQQWVFPLNQCSLKGLHNQENMLASLLVVMHINHQPQAVEKYRQTLSNFVGLPHRVERVYSNNGIDYYDDSKATNVGSVVMALAGFEGNVILIAGGRDKLGDYTPLRGLIRNKVKKLVLLGEAKERMHEVFKNDADIILANTMQDAVSEAKKSARPGDTVLLSPACSSFDQYKNYHERGLDFQKYVKGS